MITDRTQKNVDRLKFLRAKGVFNMTDAELAEYTGDPLLSDRFEHDEVVNLLGDMDFYSDAVFGLKLDGTIIATTTAEGIYLYTVAIVGAAEFFENKTLTLSVAEVSGSGALARILPYWHDGNGFEPAGVGLDGAGSVTFFTGENTGGREYLALYIYTAAEEPAAVGSYVEYRNVMLEYGSTVHEYVPYTPIIHTPSTKGAYNYTDLNRVENAVAALAEVLGLNLTTKTDWTKYDVPTATDMERYLENVRKLRKAGGYMNGTPNIPETMSQLTYAAANAIEQILIDVEASAASLLRSGEVFSGEV